jgi:hypothetical protein
MKKMTWMQGALALTVMLGATTASASDHLDGPAVKLDATTDLTDLYTFVDGANTVLILNVNPSATAATKFSDTLQYVFHTASSAAYPATMPVAVNVIATFDATQKISVWVGASDYVNGDASVLGGLTSTSGDFKVFAGLRDDPFFFNLGGFHDVEADVEAAAGGLVLNANGCPAVSSTISAALVADIAGSNHGAGPAVDFFSPSASYSGNVLSIVLSIKTSILTSGGPIMSVWASTNKES